MSPRRIGVRATYLSAGILLGALGAVPLVVAWLGSSPCGGSTLTPSPAFLPVPEPDIKRVPLPPCDSSKKDCPLFVPPAKVTGYTPEPGTLALVGGATAALLFIRRNA